jgi:hypothetical protein
VSGFGLVAGVIGAFFAFGIMTGIFAVIALSAIRDGRKRAAIRLAGEERPAWEEPLSPDDGDEAPPPWPGHHGLLSRGN